MPVRHARSGTRGLAPFGRGGGNVRKRSTRSHNASESSTAAMAVYVTVVELWTYLLWLGWGKEFCYTLVEGFYLRVLCVLRGEEFVARNELSFRCELCVAARSFFTSASLNSRQ